MQNTNQQHSFTDPEAQSGKTRLGAPDGPRQNRGSSDRRKPLELPGHEAVAQFLATQKSLREFKTVTALAKHFNITTKTIYCWMKDDNVMRRADWLSMHNILIDNVAIRCEYPLIAAKMVAMALAGNIPAMKLCADIVREEDQRAKKSEISPLSLEESLERAEIEYEKHYLIMTPSWLRERAEREAAKHKAAEENPAPEQPQGPPE